MEVAKTLMMQIDWARHLYTGWQNLALERSHAFWFRYMERTL
jgi:hypothetical protein